MRTRRPHTYIVTVALALSACAPTPSALPQGTCPPATRPTEPWPRVDLGPFSMQVPPGFEATDDQPVDSHAGAFRNASNGAQITYDYGWYSNDLAPDSSVFIEEVRCRDKTGGLPVTIVVGKRKGASGAADRYVVAAAWRDVEPGAQPVHLTVSSSTPDSAEIEILRGVLGSIRFDEHE